MKEILQNKKFFKLIIFIVVLCIPIIYSFFYLKSYWNPYGHLTELKVGIVNLDKGKDEKNQGNELVKELKDKNVMNFCEVTADDAIKGLGNDEYYAVITIPSNFTECINSASEKNKQVATITYTPNKRKNYLASQIINNVVTATETKLQSKVSTEVVGTLADSLSDVPNSLQKISDGANKIYDGTNSLNSGLKVLNNGIGVLNTKYTDFDNGVKSAYQGSTTLNNGVTQVNKGIDNLADGTTSLNDAVSKINEGASELSSVGSDKTTQLSQGISDLSNGANDLNSGVKEYVDKTNQLSNGVISYVDGVNTLNSKSTELLKNMVAYGEVSTDPTVKKMAQSAQAILDAQKAKGLTESGEKLSSGAKLAISKSSQVTAGAEKLSNGASKLQSSTSQLTKLTSGIDQLSSALAKVKSGTDTLNSGVSQLKTGTTKVQDGTKSLESGLSTLKASSTLVKNGLQDLNNGSNSAVSGSDELLKGEDTFKTEINNGLQESKDQISKLDGLKNYASEPVTVEEKDYGEVNSYGVAFMPLFISIGLWVGALMCYIILYYDQRHRFGILDYTSKNKILQNAIYLAIGAVDGLITGLLLKAGLGLSIPYVGAYLFECILVGIVFMAIIQFLIRNFGDIGKFIALILLILQLAASGGTFPVETIDSSFRAFTSFLPMTYTIRAFKDCLIATDSSLLGKNTVVLIGIVVALCGINLIIELIKKNIKKQKLTESK